MAAVHLILSYCLSSLLYACETWSLKISVHSATVALNSSFRQILNCLRCENPNLLLFYCCVLPIVHNVDQRRVLFYKKIVSQWCFTKSTCQKSVIVKLYQLQRSIILTSEVCSLGFLGF